MSEDSTMSKEIPKLFIQWAYAGRAELVRRQAEGEPVPAHEIFLGFTRHNPVVISHGSAGLNGSVKGVGFIPKPEYLDETLNAYLEHINQGWREGYSQQGLQLLMRYLYGPGCLERIDFTLFGSLELARRHSYTNLQENNNVTLLFYQPPTMSFEVRGRAEIHQAGSKYHTLLNAQHDVYHRPNPARWPERPAYLFHIEAIWDNSNTQQGFGTQIL